MIVSPGMSLVAAGVASGICFIIFSSLRKGRAADLKKETKQIIADDSHCACCFKPLLLERGVRCNDCVARSCRKSCSRWDTSDNAWRCLFCHQRRYWLRRNEKWFESFGRALIEDRDLHRYFSTAKSRVYFEGVENAAGSSKLAVPEENQENAHTMEMVRDFVEKIIEGLIGSVDDASIDRIYDHPTYDKLLAKYIVPLTGALARMTVALQLALTKLIEEMLALIGGLIVAYIFYVLITRRNDKPNTDSPEMAHTALRDIVERAVEEARKLPGLGGPKVTETEGKNIAEHSYEDLLATAILNKVIEKFQKEQVDGNSNVLHEKPASRTKCTLSESELRLDEGVEEGCSSLEPLSQDDCTECSATCSRHVRNKPEPLSLTIEERIEEVTTTYTSDEEHRDNDVLPIRNAHRVPFPELGMDIIDPSQDSSEDSQDELDSPTAHVDMVSPVESWEENWLFQKKRVQTQPDPVAMLVPNFSADFKALIGDKDAEDTSDLSECSSAQSDEEIEKELMEAISNVVPRPPKKEEFDVEHPSSDRTQDIGSEEMFTRENTGDLSKDTSNEEKTEKFEKSEKTDARISKESVKNEEKLHENGIQDEKIIEGKIESVQISNMSKETKEIKEPSIMKMEINGDEIQDGKFIDEHFEAAFEDTSKLENGIGNEKVKSQRESKETMQNSSTLDVSEKTETKNLTEKNSINSNATDTTLVPEVGMVSEVPKTPTSTPTRTSVTEGSQEVNNEEETLVRMDESVLNSLESAKKKLMVVDDDAIEAFKEEAKPLTQHKADFHTEDIQQESEYTEHYDIATQRHLDSLTKCDTFSEADIVNDKEQGQDHQNDNSRCREAVAFAKAESASYLSQEKRKQEEEEVQLAAPPRPGTIAEREHKKWENAPPIENNPYSEENIQKRLWERQYARRSSDIPGIHAELPKSNDAELDVVLRHQEPDIKRFGRDYYINDAKSPSGERGMRRSATSISSRPSSSLSQQSSSTEHEQQEDYKDTDSLVSKTSDVKSKVAKWQRNNAESNYQSNGVIQSYGAEKAEERCPRSNERQRSWEDQRVEDILENERKNSKNEVNAKLNNQENYENNGILETKKSYGDESQRKIKRIDLKAYGFENEFSSNKSPKVTSQRVVNKLDLKSFGYDDGLRRTQSNNHLDSTVNDGDCKQARIVRATNKSNLTRHSNLHGRNDHLDLIETQAAGDGNLTQSTETLNKLADENYGNFETLKSAKSVPNIAKCEYYSNSSNDPEEDELESFNSQNSYSGVNELDVINSDKIMKDRDYEAERFHLKNGDELNEEPENDTDNSFEKVNDKDSSNRKLPMPSVRRLAEAFDKQPETVSVPISKTRPNGTAKERSSTPEIHIVESPRQMHSLTARSLSKKFREGLRQIPNKVTSPPASHVAMEQNTLPENPAEVVQSKGDYVLNDRDVILPGKLKSNIKFWEQMQRKS